MKQNQMKNNEKIKNALCIECGESITNPICPECIVEQAIACLADRYNAGKLNENEIKRLNGKLAAVLKANYTEEGIDCISCKNSFAICPHCTARYLWEIIPRLSSSCFNY